ncbi:hypothetical protein Mycsm_06702 (plasmid) [Mycobacterium sp. JS623]|uniref:hypothetical protein n=1 Tax=Mycobacterium sp. JS623 TaxID=212767 RepID=UPI0002A588ED|nr:hypothetical protein [Mycobacterium sp. JS623]AGB26821.1 hypothetical protein Mycsm_06702 [Mycobacterium sp. JS623]
MSTAGTSLTELLQLVDGSATANVEYVVGGTRLSEESREMAAQMLADDAMTIACGAHSKVLADWRNRRDGGSSLSGSRQRAVATYVSIAFGLPDAPANENHVQGHVAELLWNRLMQERTRCRDGRELVRVHSVKVDPLEPGGDGLVVYRKGSDMLVFRLWEIKKHDARRYLSSTINRASSQLVDRGPEYLAKLAGAETITDDAALGDLYDNMVELWYDRSDRAGVGVSVGTSDHHAPKKATVFRSIRTRFPEFSEPAQTEGLVVAVPNFPSFVERVKEIVWSGL